MASSHPYGRDVFQVTSTLVPSTGPDYKILLIVLGGICLFAFLSVALGCCVPRCCRGRRQKKLREKQLESGMHGGLTPPSNASTPAAPSSASLSASTPARNDFEAQRQQVIERKGLALLASRVICGSETDMYPSQKERKKNRQMRSSSIMLPVLVQALPREKGPSTTHGEPALVTEQLTAQGQLLPPHE
ncbi:hypothetical protein LTR47_005217 [Exophiala xenobiotica]|nr:hypothetical protein LTR41_002955 [Exophiala xenobiotica]KAK5222570.1 hypothetical protein LTR72_005407 [Exophiala xenobiotica]KAK5233594.1 hypothetical protein LTR47_005217 [Exophiala xenobiotica]KAK5297620.1 hypothetical protein LTR14_003351 [Exophiala xenobiotica]KAK5328840.1 hypothetical protein LTR93_002625 [Exophiala xenobiotica]